ncbi:MAG: ZIP family metal transporter [Candidatus Absconditabacteria bacterium]|nr:ZIP family metal transporter [Candidatus Absconditabacteria bacterium]
MGQIRFYAIGSTLIISLIALIGIIFLGFHQEKLKKIVIYLVSFSAGALLGDVFLHLLPEMVETGFTLKTSIFMLGGILFGLVTEKVIHRNHCHMPITKTHIHHFAIMNLIGDFVHNIIDGLIIGASYLVSIPVGIATTAAILFHEIPQEIGDFGVLIHGGFSKKKALTINLLTGLSAIVGVIVALLISSYVENLTSFLIPFAAGSFIYIAGADLIPELHKENKFGQASLQILFFLIGIGIMATFLLSHSH